MPGGNGAGPMGRGPMTGRGAGYCAGYPVPGFVNRGWGGFARGMGGGRGFGRRFYPGVEPYWADDYYARPYYGWTGNEKDILTNHAEYLKDQLNQVRERIKNFEEDDKNGE